LGRVSGVRGGMRTSRCLSEIKIQQHFVLTVFKGGSFVSLESRSILLSEDRKVVMKPFFSSDCGPCLSVASLCKNKYMDRNFRAAASFMRY
jgi:thiol-disulfide isomerase/thioredoxin